MRISLNWLKDLVSITLSPEELADALTMAGFEVEDIEDRRTWAEGVVIGYVTDRQPHPNSDKLSLCTVNIGADEPSTIVCGAANVRADAYVPVAKVGTYLPTPDLKIKPREVRGVLSAGMICSLAELGLAKESEGIHIFEEADLALGSDVRPLLGLDDVVLDVTSTANRADALSMVGLAREVAAITGAELKMPIAPSPEPQTSSAAVTVSLSDPKACPIYIATVLEAVKIGPSPAWLQQRLQSAGTRSINNIVDITNYVLLEWGQPLHAFDRDRLAHVAGSSDYALSVRFGQSDERLTTLDSQERSLKPETLVITANDQPVALAGVMGGEETEVFDDTTAVTLEAAYFDSAVIRRSARSQGLRTEASARYERGVNPAELNLACDRALHLMQTLASARIVSQVTDRTPVGEITPTRTLSLRLKRVHAVLGHVVNLGTETPAPIPTEKIQDVLETLGCSVEKDADNTVWQVTIPAFRYRDLEREIDLIEEIARIYGYNYFANTLPQAAIGGALSLEADLAQRLRQSLRGAGLTELIHYSLTKPETENQVVLANPLFTEYSALRTDLINGLIEAFKFNLEQGNGPLNGFEIGRIFWIEGDATQETEVVGGILGGDARQGKWVTSDRPEPLTWFEAKGVLESVFQRLGLSVDYRADHDDSRLHPGRTASLWVRGRTRLGTFGQLHPQLRQEQDLPDEVYVFQLNWSVLVTCLATAKHKAVKFSPYSMFPASDRDIAFYAPVSVTVADLEKAMTKAGGKLLNSVTLFDEYRGESVPEGQRSLAFRLVYRALDRTLTDDDIEPVHQKVRATLEKQFKVALRS
ncbi:phenylalanine--tRNA ligase subunit beta [Oscillatoria sp. CS-180]|uniref:phenylalanine--tRNA ligase subunit beta n=1 Tax=Oscillatoria sp. CS-180 TaxID=3021720 RepID=UPI00232C2D8B|nr:phenylalanine--tRNA ligase subunit beta [Oscillatoria sp. CS-180]MDB9526766.1 phenylalanine--tRNA ligase subunit beta [Oscillatoria sp. CS-180]